MDCLDETEAFGPEGGQSLNMNEEVSKLSSIMEGLLVAFPGQTLAQLDKEVTKALVSWYKGIRDMAFVSLADPSPLAIAGQNCFNSFGLIRCAKAEVQARLDAMKSRMIQADEAVESTLKRLLVGAQNTPGNREIVVGRMATWKKGIKDECEAAVKAAQDKVNAAQGQLDKHTAELLVMIEGNYRSPLGNSNLESLSVDQMMAEVEAKFKSLELGSALNLTSGTGGTGQASATPSAAPPVQDRFIQA